MPTPEKIDSCPKCFPLMNNISPCRQIPKLLRNDNSDQLAAAAFCPRLANYQDQLMFMFCSGKLGVLKEFFFLLFPMTIYNKEHTKHFKWLFLLTVFTNRLLEKYLVAFDCKGSSYRILTIKHENITLCDRLKS